LLNRVFEGNKGSSAISTVLLRKTFQTASNNRPFILSLANNTSITMNFKAYSQHFLYDLLFLLIFFSTNNLADASPPPPSPPVQVDGQPTIV